MESQPLITTFLALIFFASLFILGSSSSSSNHTDDLLKCLTVQFQHSNSITDNVIYTPQTTSYQSLSQPLNLRTSHRKPLLIITPFHVSEIRASIICSKKLGIQIIVRSGGHDYEGLSYTSTYNNRFITLDMRNIRSISINAKHKTAWVEVGATLGQLYHTLTLESRNLAFTAGVCPTVGVGGHFSGGGYGMLSRKHALAADRIIDAILVNADGQTLDRKSMGEDLFWAIRGGGGSSFGIVVAFKVKLVTVPETVTVFNVTRTLEQNATQLVHRWQYVADKVNENLMMRLFLTSVKSPTSRNRTISASFTSLYLGRVGDLLPLMRQEFPELDLVEGDCAEMSWVESTVFFAGLQNQSIEVLLSRTPQGKTYSKGKSDYVKQPIPVQGLRGIWRFLKEEDENMAELQFSPYGGALNTFSESETPFPHRSGNIFTIHYAVRWTGQENSERHMDWIRRFYAYMAPYVSQSPRAAYFNYRDLDLGMNNEENTSYRQASVWGVNYFGNNFDRLVRVKTKVDPSNFFRNEQSIPPLVSMSKIEVRSSIVASHISMS